MDDNRIWQFERELWLGGGDVYRERVAKECVMALPADPFIFDGEAATRAVENTPRWSEVEFVDRQVERPHRGLIVIAYRAMAKRDGESYHALATSTLMQLEHEQWVVVQHSQTPLGVMVAGPQG